MDERPDTPPVVVVEDVSKTFRMPHERVHTLKERALHPLRNAGHNEFAALKNVSFDVRRGEFFGIVGRNGSGKSTLLKCLAGIYSTDKGSIQIDGRLSTFIELGVGFNPDLAARDNAMINAVMLGLSRREARERFDHIIEFAELEDFVDLKLKNYSSGMHVRLAFSVMIQVDADVLLIDEVLAVGDAAFQQKCFDEFHRLRDEAKTIVLVTHDMGAVRRFCHRAMLMERGEVVAMGDPETIGSQYMEINFRRIPESAVESDVIDHGVEPYRFGSGQARVTDVWVEDETGERIETAPQGRDLVLRAAIEFNDAMEDPVVGLSIENEDHWPVFATQTTWFEERTGAFRAGDRATLTVRLPNVLAPGRYHVSPHVARRGSGLELVDRRPRMHSFVVTGTRATGGILEMDHDLRFE